MAGDIDDVYKGFGIASQGMSNLQDAQKARLAAAMEAHKAELLQGQKLREQAQQEQKTYLDVAIQAKDPALLKWANNRVAALDAVLNPDPNTRYRPVDNVDDVVTGAYKGLGTLNEMVDKGLITPQQLEKIRREYMSDVYKTGGGDKAKEFQEMITNDMAQVEATRKEELQKSATISDVDRIIGTVDEALAQTGLFSAGLASLTKWIPGTPAKDLDEKVSSIKAALGINQMQALKAMSPTGSTGFGNQSDKELKALQSAISSLDIEQSPKQTRESLMKVAKHYGAWKEIVNKAKGQPALGSVPAPTGGLTPEKQSRLEELRAKQKAGTLGK